MFDAAHRALEDSTSQGGCLIFIVPKKIFSEETSYHLIAEAQAFGQAADMVEFICRYWICLFNPPAKLKDCLEQKSDLEPVMNHGRASSL